MRQLNGTKLLALQFLSIIINPANFNSNTSRVFKLTKSLNRITPRFAGKSEKFELFEDVFQTNLKIHNQLTEDDKLNCCRSHERWCIANFQKHHKSNARELGIDFGIFSKQIRQASVNGHSKAQIAAPCLQFIESKCSRCFWTKFKNSINAFGVAAHANVEQFKKTETPLHLNKSTNQAHLENGNFEQILAHLERESEFNSSNAPDELREIIVNQ